MRPVNRWVLATAIVISAAVAVAPHAAMAAAPSSSTASSSPDLSTDPYSVYNKMERQYLFGGQSINTKYWSVYNGGQWTPRLASVNQWTMRLGTSVASGSGVCLCQSTRPAKPYGRWDVRARTTVDPNHGFAILLWPNDESNSEGEIDLAEFSGDRTRLFTTLHYGPNNSSRYILRTKGDFTKWHVYSVAWSAKELDYAVDGKIVMRIHDTAAIPDIPMHPVIQAQPYHSQGYPAGSAHIYVAWVKHYIAKG